MPATNTAAAYLGLRERRPLTGDSIMVRRHRNRHLAAGTRSRGTVWVMPFVVLLLASAGTAARAQDTNGEIRQHTLFDLLPRVLVDMPTAGTLPRGNFNIGLRLYDKGGAQGYTDIGLSSRFQLGISFGGVNIISSNDPDWNPRIGFSLKLRLIDELEVFPALAVGYSDQGNGAYSDQYERYTFKSRGFYAVMTRSFYFYKWTSSWHLGVNYSLEDNIDNDDDINPFLGFDVTFDYNLGIFLEYDAALNDDKSAFPEIAGRGRGYLNMSVKWLFARNLELEVLATDMLVNRRDSETFGRGIRILYIDSF